MPESLGANDLGSRHELMWMRRASTWHAIYLRRAGFVEVLVLHLVQIWIEARHISDLAVKLCAC